MLSSIPQYSSMNKILLLISLFLLASKASSQEYAKEISLNGVRGILNYHEESQQVIVLVNGSARPDINETVPFGPQPPCVYEEYKNLEFRIFEELSDKLYNEGYSVIRYEKLNTRKKALDEPASSLPSNFAKDLYDIVKWLSRSETFRSKEIVLLGWSEGVSVALNILKYDTQVSGIIGFGGVFNDIVGLTARKLFKITLCENDTSRAISYQKQFLEQVDVHPSQRIDNESQNKILLESIIYDPENPTIVMGTHTAYYGDYTKEYYWDFTALVEESIPLIKDSEKPILMIHGDSDFNVPISQHRFLESQVKGEPNVQLELLSNTDHLFRKKGSTKFTDEIIKIIDSWLIKETGN